MFLFSRLMSRAPQVMLSFLVFALSSGVVGGVLFYTDWTGPQVFRDTIQETPVDMEMELTFYFYQQNTTTADDITDMVMEQEGVTGTEQLFVMNRWEGDYEYYQSTYAGVDDTFFDSFENAVDVAPGSPPLNDSTCYMEVAALSRLGLSIGNEFTIRDYMYDEYGNVTKVNHTMTIVGTFKSQVFIVDYYWQGPPTTTLRLITTRQGLEEAFGSARAYYDVGRQIWVRMNHDIVSSMDPVSAAEELDNVRKRIEQRTLPYAWVMYDGYGLRDAVLEYAAWSSSTRAVALAVSVPTIIMGVMLVQYDSTLLADERRRDIGALKTRGASGWQAFNWVLSSALFTGAVGSFGAVLAGLFAALLSGTVRTLMEFDLSRLEGLSFVLVPESILFVFLFSFIVGLLVALPAAVKGLLMSPTEAHATLEREVLLKPETTGNPVIEMIGLAISGSLFMNLILLLTYVGYVPSAQVAVSIIVVPLLAIFVVLFTRLLSRPTASIKAKALSWLKRPPLSAGSILIGRNLTMFRRSESIGVMFISLVFAAGILSALSATTGFYHTRDLLMFEAGADVRIDVKPGLENVTLDMIDNITSVPGVQSAAAMLSVNTYVTYQQESWMGTETVNTSMTVFGVQPTEWYESAFWLEYFAYSRTPYLSLHQLAQSNTSVISSFRPVIVTQFTPTGVVVTYSNNITLWLRTMSWVNHSHCTIVDVLCQDKGGGGVKYFPGEPDIDSFLIINLAYLHGCTNTSRVNRFYVHLEDGANYTRVIQDLYDMAPNSYASIESGLREIDKTLEAQAGRSIYGVYTLNVLFSLTYLTIGMAVISGERARRLRKQMSVLRALGAGYRPVTLSALLDTFVGVLIAAAIGGLLGLVLSSSISQIPLAYIGTETSVLWNRLPVLLVIPMHLILSIIGLTLLFSLSATYIATKRSLTRNLAEEIQSAE